MHRSTSDYAWKLYYVTEAIVKNHCCKMFECCSMFVFVMKMQKKNFKKQLMLKMYKHKHKNR